MSDENDTIRRTRMKRGRERTGATPLGKRSAQTSRESVSTPPSAQSTNSGQTSRESVSTPPSTQSANSGSWLSKDEWFSNSFGIREKPPYKTEQIVRPCYGPTNTSPKRAAFDTSDNVLDDSTDMFLASVDIDSLNHCDDIPEDLAQLLDGTLTEETCNETLTGPQASDKTGNIKQRPRVENNAACGNHVVNHEDTMRTDKIIQTNNSIEMHKTSREYKKSHEKTHSSNEIVEAMLPSNNQTGDEDLSKTLNSKECLIRRLQNNAQMESPTISKAAELKAKSIASALREAELICEDPDRCDVGPFYGLPSKVKELLVKTRGISQLYEWQNECLTLKAVSNRQNLIYSLPTSGGKTLVAEILIMRELLCRKKDAIIILPFVSIVQEKVRNMSSFAVDLDFLVEEYAGSRGAMPPRKRRSRRTLYVATIEKAHSLINSLIECERLKEIGLVVVDELHMLGEGASRGAILEMSLTKFMYQNSAAQIIGMSATLSNIKDLVEFLKAELYTNDFRPVELKEYLKIDETLYEVNSKALCPDDKIVHSRTTIFPYSSSMLKTDPDHLLGLVSEVVPDYSCLIFCPTKKNCENVAVMLCKLMPRKLAEVNSTKRKALISQLRVENNGPICPVLKKTVLYGVAYHHSGLTMDERKLIEDSYSAGVLCLLCCTSTLAAGVNLPAKRVILRSPYVGQEFVSRSQYKQMIGRAGRAGIDTSGESILVINKYDRSKVMELISCPVNSCKSSLLHDGQKSLRRLLLSLIGLKITSSTEDLLSFMKHTLYAVQSRRQGEEIITPCVKELHNLTNMRLIEMHPRENGEESLLVTRLGRAVFKGSVDADVGSRLYTDLCQAQESLVLANYLHLLYLATPYDMVTHIKPPWMTYFSLIGSLTKDELKVPALLGISEEHLARKASNQRVKKEVETSVVNRFYLTLILYDIWRQVTIWDVAAKYQLSRGFIQNLVAGAATFASGVFHFCMELEEFWAYQDLLEKFVKKLSFCGSIELVPLMEIPGVKQARARQLHAAGYKTIQQIGHADVSDMIKIEHILGHIASQIVSAAQMILKERAEALREEADEIVAMPIAKTMPLEETEVHRTPSDSQATSQASTIRSSLIDSQDIDLFDEFLENF